jgi:hypothetical protein
VERGEVLLEERPLGGIFFGGEGEFRVGVVGEDVVLDARRDGYCRRGGKAVEEGCVGVVGEAVAGGFYGAAGVQVAVDEGVFGVARTAGDDLRGSGNSGNGV